MALLTVKATADPSLTSWIVEIDGNVAVVHPSTAGSATVNGTCDDGSSHRADFSFYGPAGAKFAFTIKCGDQVVASIATKVPAATAPNAADYVEFTI